MYYDKRGNMQAAGAEAESASVLSQAEDEGWIKAELYVLSPSLKAPCNGSYAPASNCAYDPKR
jgi:hypothetical protein